MSVMTESKLGTTLLEFQRIFNEHRRVKKLIKKWNRSIFIEAEDTGEKYTMVVRDQQMNDILEGFGEHHGSDDERILLQAEADVMSRVFSGDYNPAAAHIDGALKVFSGDRDKVKLEAIAMVIWGLN